MEEHSKSGEVGEQKLIIAAPPARHRRRPSVDASPTVALPQYDWSRRRLEAAIEESSVENGLSPFLTSVFTGGVILSVYLAGRQAYRWFTTRQQGKKERRSPYGVADENEDESDPHW